MKAFERSVLNHHDSSTRNSSISSFRATRESKFIEKELKNVLDTINLFDQEVEKFNDKMTNVQKREIARLDLEERIRQNAGKKLDYFQLPSVARKATLVKNKNRSAQDVEKFSPTKSIFITKL